MMIFRIEHDINTYLGFIENDPDIRDDVQQAMRLGKPLAPIWQGCTVAIIPGKTGDFATSPFSTFAPIALNKHAVSVLGSLLSGVGELLPFTHRKREWWMLYLPNSVDCLDERRTVYYTDRIAPNNIRQAAFVRKRLPSENIFRVSGGYDYFVTEKFKRTVEQHALTGLAFELMWSDESSENAKSDAPPIESPTNPRRVGKSRRRSKRERLLNRLWRDVINRSQSAEWWEEIVEGACQASEDASSLSHDAGRVLNAAVQRGLTPSDIRRMTRSLAYQVVFETLVAIEEEGADTGRALRCLHEDLLMANPDGYEE